MAQTLETPVITGVFRFVLIIPQGHTFCTNVANAGTDVKALQYLMGHFDVGVTLNIYTHASYDRAAEQMAKLVDFRGAAARWPGL